MSNWGNLELHYYRELFASISEAIVVVDRDGRILEVNAEFCKVFGYAAEEAEDRFVDDLIAPEGDASSAATLTEAVARGEKITLETVRRRKDGSPVHVSLLALPVATGPGEALVFAVYRDITDRKRAELALAESRHQLEEAYHQLELISNLDGLTGIPNRRYFENFYGLEWRRLCREGKPISLIMVDIDYFKRFNDTYGHLAGDRCLKRVAQALRVVNRAGDLVARFGGEEFIAVVSGTRLEDARKIAEQMRNRVKALQIPHSHSKAADHVTVSLGVACEVPVPHADPMEAVLKADQALYLAKAKGRDRVEGIEVPGWTEAPPA